MKKVAILALLFCNLSMAQQNTCEVVVPELKGIYEGECSGGKANGKGKAIGENTYEGLFKNGYPEGQGKYTWKNTNWFEGSFKKGLQDGEGTMHVKITKGSDSVITGFWKNGAYMGLYESPYKIINKGFMVSNLRVAEEKMVSTNINNNAITINLESVSGGSVNMHGEIPKMVISAIDIRQGSFVERSDVTSMQKTNIYVLRGVIFPFSASFKIGTDDIVIDFYKTANWRVDIKMRQ